MLWAVSKMCLVAKLHWACSGPSRLDASGAEPRSGSDQPSHAISKTCSHCRTQPTSEQLKQAIDSNDRDLGGAHQGRSPPCAALPLRPPAPPVLTFSRAQEIYDSFQDPGRSLDDILDSKGPLRGAEAQKLRGHFSGYQLNPAHCDNFELVSSLMVGRKAKLADMFEDMVKAYGGDRRKAIQTWNDCECGLWALRELVLAARRVQWPAPSQPSQAHPRRMADRS